MNKSNPPSLIVLSSSTSLIRIIDLQNRNCNVSPKYGDVIVKLSIEFEMCVKFIEWGKKMAGHPLLQQSGSKTEIVNVAGRLFHIQLSFHQMHGISGIVAGLKFADQSGSMDSAKSANIDPFNLGRVIAAKAVKMLESELHKIEVLGFYLLTDDLAARDPKAIRAKTRLYNARAVDIHKMVKHKLQFITRFEVDGGLGWAMSEKDFGSYEQFKVFENELAKQIRISTC